MEASPQLSPHTAPETEGDFWIIYLPLLIDPALILLIPPQPPRESGSELPEAAGSPLAQPDCLSVAPAAGGGIGSEVAGEGLDLRGCAQCQGWLQLDRVPWGGLHSDPQLQSSQQRLSLPR